MRQQVFYIHGGSAYSDYADYMHDLQHSELRNDSTSESMKKWPSTLRDRLGESYQVFMPTFPNSQNSKYEEWKIWFERHHQFLQDGLILVGWSQGAMFITRYLVEQALPVTVQHLFLLASPFDYFVTAGAKEDGGDFYTDPEKIKMLAEKVPNITIMHSTDDFVVPYEHALKYKQALPEAELVTFTDKNHFLVEELPELVERIKQLPWKI